MGTVFDSSELTSKLESLLTALAKACLTEKPRDVDKFCLEFLATRQGLSLQASRVNAKGTKQLAEEELNEADALDYSKVVSRFGSKNSTPTRREYVSSDESHADDDDEIKSVASYRTNASRFEGVDEITTSDLEDANNVKTAPQSELDDDHHMEEQSCYLFSTDVISPEELQMKTDKYKNDERMKSLFRAWDGDDSGAVDFVELVLALHKFEEVSRAGIDIQVASDALVQFVECDTDRELKLAEFARVIILFSLNNFKKDFDEVADHMLAVATSTSEEVVRQAAQGADTTALEAADKAEQEFLLETVKCMEEQVTDNIRKIRTKRVAFRQSPRNAETTGSKQSNEPTNTGSGAAFS